MSTHRAGTRNPMIVVRTTTANVMIGATTTITTTEIIVIGGPINHGDYRGKCPHRYNKALKGPCKIHPKSSHPMENCCFLKNIYAKQLANDDAPKAIDDGPWRDSDDDDDDKQDRNPRHQYVNPTKTAHFIFGRKVFLESKRECKLLKWAYLNVVNTDDLIFDPRLPAWSHHEISFSRVDRWAAISEPGRFPLVLDPCINSVRFERVLMDSGSSIDILFRSSLYVLKLTQADLKPYDAQFWGVLPGQSSIPLGQITLHVQFGNPNHFHTDYVNFVATDFEGTYHIIRGRPMLTKFMVVPHYSYLVLKMPTEQDVLTLRGNVYIAYTYEEESFKVAEATNLSICMEQTLVNASKILTGQLEISKHQAPRKHIKSNEHKEIQLVDDDPSKTALIRANLDPK
jgi:hypothetical protein